MVGTPLDSRPTAGLQACLDHVELEATDPTDERMDRETLMLALARLASDRGIGSVSEAEVAQLAGVPLSTFALHFDSTRECLLALCEVTGERLVGAVEAAVAPCGSVGGPDRWRRQLESGFGAALQFLSAVPTVTRACLVEAPALGEEAVAARETTVEELIEHAERLQNGEGDELPALASEMLVRGAFELIQTRAVRNEIETLPDLLPELRALWSGPYGSG